MNGIPWWLAFPAVIEAVVTAGFCVLAVWIRLNGPRVAARWNAAVRAETEQRPALEEVTR